MAEPASLRRAYEAFLAAQQGPTEEARLEQVLAPPPEMVSAPVLLLEKNTMSPTAPSPVSNAKEPLSVPFAGANLCFLKRSAVSISSELALA